jgi:anaerobic magnesium-protoporphyrin IX monomethyl ester cyclase
MNILLLRPPATYYCGSTPPSASLPLGLLYIAALLEREGFPPAIYDAQINTDTPVSQDGRALLMGDRWEIVEKKVAAAKADIVGINCGFSTQLPNALRMADIVRKTHPGSIIIVGGPHASVRPGDFLEGYSPVDLVCIGEGEYTMLDLVRTAAARGNVAEIAGTAVWSSGVQYNPYRPRIENLDELPFPAYHLVGVENYFQLYGKGYSDRLMPLYEGFNRAVSVVTSRGCPFNCIFCSIHQHMGKRWRGNSVKYVTEHVELLAGSYGVRHIHFEDDNISFSRPRFEGIVANLSRHGITWDTPNGVRVDTLTESLVEQCKKSGCTYLVFGVESGNQRVLDTVVDKRLDLTAVVKAAEWCKKSRLDAMAFYVIGFPGESRDDMRDSIVFALKLFREFDVKPHLFLATPLPGTRLEKILLERNLIETPLGAEHLANMTQGNFCIGGGTFSSADVDVLLTDFAAGYRKIFLRNVLKFIICHPFSIIQTIKLLIRSKNGMTLREKLISIMQTKFASLMLQR